MPTVTTYKNEFQHNARSNEMSNNEIVAEFMATAMMLYMMATDNAPAGDIPLFAAW